MPRFSKSECSWTLSFILSGASSLMTPNYNNIQQPQSYSGNEYLEIGNGESLLIQHSGQGILPTPNRSQNEQPTSHWTRQTKSTRLILKKTAESTLSILQLYRTLIGTKSSGISMLKYSSSSCIRIIPYICFHY
ncbi:uncharacterized protein LOC110030463 [Phalaenopsis equestris]|uniref:uncharacterized protein LOC110030463 n=1 Tax=Phalaenopsis equestris TaxID=78828 RepID=UPI0009E2BEEE|nr:uncharacterized protein LOC110030463 [Phalaenopsis equestris]